MQPGGTDTSKSPARTGSVTSLDANLADEATLAAHPGGERVLRRAGREGGDGDGDDNHLSSPVESAEVCLKRGAVHQHAVQVEDDQHAARTRNVRADRAGREDDVGRRRRRRSRGRS